MFRSLVMLCLGALLTGAACVHAAEPAPLFPFVLPWDDASPSVTNVSDLLERPAGKAGFITARDGHLVAGANRIRLLGVNLCFGANFPTHADADKIAARMAKFGINCVRFHHMDNKQAPGGIFSADMKTLDPGQLDKLDYFIAQLKAQGIYADLNLHVSRDYPGMTTADGMGAYGKGVDEFMPSLLALQRQYAQDLLTHVNPYTGARYADEPAIAFVEINNENGLLQEWWWGHLDHMPEEDAAELRAQWNRWLQGKYGTEAALHDAWQITDGAIGAMPVLRVAEYKASPRQTQADWIRFLYETEERYWLGMYRYLKDELKVGSLVLGTQVGFSPASIQAQLDVIDQHSYWQHPRFPKKPWDPVEWTVGNIAMAGQPNGGTLPGLGLSRVAGKPFIVTEYNHAAPNTYGSEAFLLLAAYAGMQDWDAIFAFTYSHRTDGWNARAIRNFFDIDQHPTKMATMPTAALLFLRGDMPAPAIPLRPYTPQSALVRVTQEQLLERIRTNGPIVRADQFGLPRDRAMTHQVGMTFDPAFPGWGPTHLDGRRDDDSGPVVISDDYGMAWNPATHPGAVLINTPRVKGIVGKLGTAPIDFPVPGRAAFGDLPMAITPGVTRQDWATITVSLLQGYGFRYARRFLVTATGEAENTNMRWTDATRTSVGNDWGTAPSRVEGIAATITLPIPAADVRVWALDACGARTQQVPVTALADGQAVSFALDPRYQTLWYEVAIAE